MNIIGQDVLRIESLDKVTGKAKYTDDYIYPDLLYAKILTSTFPHANIEINTTKAEQLKGVVSVIVGEKYNILSGSILEDRPPLALGKVRYYGEPVAMVVAFDERVAAAAVKLIEVEYEPLEIIFNPKQSILSDSILIHPNLSNYTKAIEDVKPESKTNVANRVKIRKGDMNKGWAESDIIVEHSFSLPQSDHIAMENRCSIAEIQSDGTVNITTSSQSPFEIKKQISKYFKIPEGKIKVIVPLVGGGFGGKSAVNLELLAYIASHSVNGRKVKITNTREEDMISSPCRMGLEARVKMGVTKAGIFKAIEIEYLLDNGAYTDIGPRIAKAMAVDCTGPYFVENIYCDSLSVYTNHPYITAYRGFGHDSYTFCIERVIEKVAHKLGMDALELRLLNAIQENDYSPTQVKITKSNLGDLKQCITRLKSLINWNDSNIIKVDNKIIAKGISCLWKTSNTLNNASSGALITFNQEGSVNLNIGAVEFGQGCKTHLSQILAEKLKMDINRIHINLDVNTSYSPEHWKTVASMTNYLAGRAVIKAAEDVIKQLKAIASVALRCSEEDLDVAGEKVFIKYDPEFSIGFQDIVHGLIYPDGNSVGSQILGRGGYVIHHITHLDDDTGKGKTGNEWTVGAQAVEIEYDTLNYNYRILKAATVLDVGKVINPSIDRGIVIGGMCMGLGLATREEFKYTGAKVDNTSLRNYKVMHIGQEPQYLVDFVETPNIESPYGVRGFSEHGTIGIHAALANALSLASGCEIDSIPIYPEKIWNIKNGAKK